MTTRAPHTLEALALVEETSDDGVNMAHENIIVAKGHKVNSPSVFFLFAGVFAAAATGGALGASTVGVYMMHSSRSKTGASIDYIAKALEYGKAVDDGMGWAGIIAELTESPMSPWYGQVCMINAYNTTTIKEYAEWAQASFEQFPKMTSIAWKGGWDPVTMTAFVYAVWTGANTAGPGATNRLATGNFVYMLHFNGRGKIDSFTKVWNDAWSARQLGWPDMCHCPSSIEGFPCYDPPLGPIEPPHRQ